MIWSRRDFFYSADQPSQFIEISEFDDADGMISSSTDVIHGHTPNLAQSNTGSSYTSLDSFAGKTREQFRNASYAIGDDSDTGVVSGDGISASSSSFSISLNPST
jgi:hypothetical protein